MSNSETEAWFLMGRTENRNEHLKPLLMTLCPSVTVAELLSQLDCSNSAFFLVKNSSWLFSCSLNYSGFLQGGTSAVGFLLTAETFLGEHVQESGLVTPVTTRP